MPLKPGDPERFAQILEAAIIAERMTMRIQFEADEQDTKTIERAQTMRRNAIGLKKSVEEWMQELETAAT